MLQYGAASKFQSQTVHNASYVVLSTCDVLNTG